MKLPHIDSFKRHVPAAVPVDRKDTVFEFPVPTDYGTVIIVIDFRKNSFPKNPPRIKAKRPNGKTHEFMDPSSGVFLFPELEATWDASEECGPRLASTLEKLCLNPPRLKASIRMTTATEMSLSSGGHLFTPVLQVPSEEEFKQSLELLLPPSYEEALTHKTVKI